MKKIIKIICFVFVFCFVLLPTYSIASAAVIVTDGFDNGAKRIISPFYTLSHVLTPNGSEVPAYYDLCNLAKPSSRLLNAEVEIEYPNAVRIKEPSGKYNGHSYAWHSQEEGNLYWINDPSAYYMDGSYYQVEYPAVGDIVCYFDITGENIHSGIVVDKTSETMFDVDSIVVESKWGIYGVYRHKVDECPYMQNHGEGMVVVKYYRRHSQCDYYYKCIEVNGTNCVGSCFCGRSILMCCDTDNCTTDPLHKQVLWIGVNDLIHKNK